MFLVAIWEHWSTLEYKACMVTCLSVEALKAVSLKAFNPLCVKFFRGNKNIYLHFISFLHIDLPEVVEILPQVRQGLAYSNLVNIMAVDDLATQGARASAAMTLTLLNRDNLVPTH